MSYIGSTPTTQSFISGTDYFNGDGSTTAFTLSRSVVSVNDIEVVINNVVQQPNTAYTINGTTITFTSAPSSGTSNIYVRYLSTTTQSITPSQNTVSYSTWNSDLQNKTWGFKNRIINGAMVIDQRNAGSLTSPAIAGYYVDRWYYFQSQSSKGTIGQNAGSVTLPAGYINYLGFTSTSAYSINSTDQFFIQQPIEGLNIADLGWGSANAKTVTLSAWVYSSLTGTFGGALQNSAANRCYPFSYTISAANTWTQISITITGDTTGTWLTTNGTGVKVIFSLASGTSQSAAAGAWTGTSFITSATGATSVVGTNGATFYITGVQLEVGTQATNFDVRSYGTELQLCQRYYQQLAKGTGLSLIGTSSYFSSTRADGVMFFPTSMRTAPTFSIVTGAGYYRTYLAGSTYTAPTLYVNGYTATYSGIYFYNNLDMSGLSNGAGWWETANANSFIAVNAEL